MAQKRDYYDVLEVVRNASSEDLRRSYRRLAKKYHPDVSQEPGAEERFKEINEAYAVLSNEEQRSAYDRYGHAGLRGVPTDVDFGLGDIFEEFFGFTTGSRRSRRWHAEAIGLASLWPMLSDEVTRSVQGGLAVLYVPTQIGDDLVADLTSANAPPALINRVISLGQGASGWAASAGDVVPVADAYLDLGTVADELGLRSCFAAPLVRDSTLLGVLTVYSTGNLAPREIALLKTLAAGLAAQADSARPAPLRPPATADPTQTNPRVLSDRF